MKGGIGRPAGGGDHRCGVFEGLAGDDGAGPQVGLDELHHLLAGSHAEPVAEFVRGGSAGRIRQRKPDRLGDRRHRIGGELRPTGAGRRARHLLQGLQVLIGHLADRVLADRFEHVLHRDRLALERAGQDRAAVDEDGRHVEPAHRHHHAGQRFVAAGEPDQGVVAVAADGQLDRIRDDLARRQGRFHALMAHGDAVGHGDGAELPRGAAGRRDALFRRLGLAHQRDVARGSLVPATCDTHERLVDLLGRQPHGVIVGSMRRPLRAFGHVTAGKSAFEAGLGVHEICALLRTRVRRSAVCACGHYVRYRDHAALWRKRGGSVTPRKICQKL